MDDAWMCVVLAKSLCSKGPIAAKKEIQRLTGESFCDFRFVDDGFEEECYSFVKCKLSGNYMENFRRSPHIITVLSSYDSPIYLNEDEVTGFVVEEEGEKLQKLYYGDIVVVVGGNSPYKGLTGIVAITGYEKSQVFFRFHTLSNRFWFNNRYLHKVGTVLKYLKLPLSVSEDTESY